jgi:hypothetical protein
MRAVQRILDANINRAAEGMRVLEDLARFLLDRKDLCGAIKQCRHEIRSISQSDIAWSRDTSGDVGTTHTTQCEDTREHVSDIAAAAGNRCAEALRVIEELLKLDNKGSEIESIRYRMYDHAAEVFIAMEGHASTIDRRWLRLHSNTREDDGYQRAHRPHQRSGFDCQREGCRSYCE